MYAGEFKQMVVETISHAVSFPVFTRRDIV
jgi:hypothetical protein